MSVDPAKASQPIADAHNDYCLYPAAMTMLKRTSSGTSASSVSSGAEWQTAQHSSQPSNLSSTDRPALQAGADVQAASSSNPSPQAPRSGAGDASTFSSRQTQSPKSSEPCLPRHIVSFSSSILVYRISGWYSSSCCCHLIVFYFSPTFK